LEDGETSIFNAKLVDPAYFLTAGDWFDGHYHVAYSVTLLQVT
jgi:hypothetical protein